MKKLLLQLCLILVIVSAAFAGTSETNMTGIPDQVRAQQIRDMKFGMFICWSFSTFSGQEWTPDPG